MVEILADDSPRKRREIREITRAAGAHFGQESVLLTVEPVEVELI